MTKISKIRATDLGVTIELEGEKVDLPWRNLIVRESKWRKGALVIPCICPDEQHWGELVLTPYGFAQVRINPAFHFDRIPQEIRNNLQLTPIDSSAGVGDFWVSIPFSP
ncbi:MAG: hypothetical protein L3K23_02230 [Thermoplasmata archaeon]|nr:hypothetical protein [Thermoplasmata archaeon]